jgi:hypothetical protein
MPAQPGYGVEFAFELFLGQKLVDLRMAGAAKANDLSNFGAWELAFVPLVVMPSSRNEVMTSQSFLSLAEPAASFHRVNSSTDGAASSR